MRCETIARFFFSRLNGMCFARVENVWEISNFQCRRYRL